MKKIILLNSLAIFAFVFSASAQRDEARVDSARAAIDETRQYRGDSEFRADRDFQRGRVRADYAINRLNRDVRDLRYELRNARTGQRIRDRFERLKGDTDRLTALYRRNRLRSWEVIRRAEDLRADAGRIRAMLRGR
ncbi:MAG: hypothetical protein M3R10_06560 [Verrucomicrobiota bacterium]|nr:hypothetical protein [Verrucomicrobiota bacterium]